MRADPRPAIFVSATSRDLGTCRQRIKEALLTLGCVPVEQRNFPIDSRTVRQMLREQLRGCQAVIHLAGMVYGAEPAVRAADAPRRSYTQLEFDIARELGIPVYVFVCGEQFPYDHHEGESEELAQLQRAHRLALTAGDSVYEEVPDLNVLERRVFTLQDRVAAIRSELASSRRGFRIGIGVASVVVALLGVGLHLINQQTVRNTAEIASVLAELGRQRALVREVVDAYTRMKSELSGLRLSPEQLWERALESVAQAEGVDRERLSSEIRLFVEAIRADPSSEFLDRALADIATRDFGSSVENAGKAVERARAKRTAAENLAASAEHESKAARGEESSALAVLSHALFATGDFKGAVAAIESALAITDPGVAPAAWAELQLQLGVVELEWARRLTGDLISERNLRAIDAFRAALEAFTRESMAGRVASTKNDLAIALRDRASFAVGPERAALLSESVRLCREVLEFYSRDRSPQGWAMAQSNLANALSLEAEGASSAHRIELIAECVACCRRALEVRTREAYPLDWAATSNNLSIALMFQASSVEGPECAELLAEAIRTQECILDVYTREAMPQDWAMTQANLAIAIELMAQFGVEAGAARVDLLSEAVRRYQLVLEVYTPREHPQHRSAAQHNLGNVYRYLAAAAGAGQRGAHLAKAVQCYELALEVRTLASMPQQWAKTQKQLAETLCDLGLVSAEPRRTELLRSAADAMVRYLDDYAVPSRASDIDERRRWTAEVRSMLSADHGQ